MELTKSQELIIRLKEAKKAKNMKFTTLINLLEKNKTPVSLTTLRRVFADNSERNDSFSYENTLLPIAEILLTDEYTDVPGNSPEIDALTAVIHVQNEEIARLHEIKEHQAARITFLLEQIEKKDRRMDEKDALIQKLMDKYGII